MSEDSKSKDILGIAPFGKALQVLAEGAVDGARAFLSRICLRAADEFGSLLRDKISFWRAKNMLGIIAACQSRPELAGAFAGKQVHPRLLMNILDAGSWCDDERMQGMWAGLIASSCSGDGKDEGNLIFISLLSQLTSAQAKLLEFACKESAKVERGGLVSAQPLDVEIKKLAAISGLTDIVRLDLELDHLRFLELIDMDGGIDARTDASYANVTPSGIALNMYVRCQGCNDPPSRFYEIAECRGKVPPAQATPPPANS